MASSASYARRAANPWLTDRRAGAPSAVGMASVDPALADFYAEGGAPSWRADPRDFGELTLADTGAAPIGYSFGAPATVLGGVADMAAQARAATAYPDGWTPYDFALVKPEHEPRPYGLARAGRFGSGKSAAPAGAPLTFSRHGSDSIYNYKRLERPELMGGRDKPEFDPYEVGGPELAVLRAWRKRQDGLASAYGLEDSWPRANRFPQSIEAMTRRSDPATAGAPFEIYDSAAELARYRARSGALGLH